MRERSRRKTALREPDPAGILLLADRRRGDADRRDLVALAAQYLEPEAIEREGLADLGYAPRLVENEARERRRLIVRQVPFELAVEVADRDQNGRAPGRDRVCQ